MYVCRSTNLDLVVAAQWRLVIPKDNLLGSRVRYTILLLIELVSITSSRKIITHSLTDVILHINVKQLDYYRRAL